MFELKRLLCLLCVFGLMLNIVSCASKPTTTRTGTKPYTVRGQKYYPLQSAHGFVEEGVASWYGPGFHGKTTANGERYNQNAMTAAHKLLPLGTTVRVTNLENNESVVLRINDRGPFVHDRVIDVSKRAAERLDMHDQGTANVRIEAINTKSSTGKSGDSSKVVASTASSASAIEQARKSRVLNEDGEIPDDLKYLFEEEGSVSTAKASHKSNTNAVQEQAPYAEPMPYTEPATYQEPATHTEPATYSESNNQTNIAPSIDVNSVFYIQVGAFKVKKFASFAAETLKDDGFSARSYKEPGQDLWRVRIGPWTSAAKAEEFLPRFSQEFPSATVVTDKAKR